MHFENPWRLIGIGGVLVFAGAVLPFLMVMRILESTFVLNFFSYGTSVIGMVMGIIGSSMVGARRKSEQEQEDR